MLQTFSDHTILQMEAWTMRGALLWLVGVPIPIIILLYLFNVI